ncbi:Zn(2)-C6 fungal-type DNA-binding domain protein [Cordyceps fumosorosea ARSEF 2679]|uniref:Zn(2)-C6 fungal-type DNA-binding domain protein n=1 Tax=Cordyceps fumosorosea (strain ARSEF 2679) TaxID=1081104 RepID=A0A167YH72_CORFA|nr:Zn(2)-C6 fungal-type DNA-binding domain protein [Cordyceps fumosorosea ARSEF 2679]OAA66323.1 Zn(2)-C6 fungal-type DNA-binding domain protein [Cordyceps fumosorosea ARSEF 2679]
MSEPPPPTQQQSSPPLSQQGRPALRPLLPAAARKRDATTPGSPARTTRTVTSRLTKTPNTAAACDNCRKHKTKCSGDRPACRRCAQRRLPCIYAARPGETEAQAVRRGYRALRARATEHEEVVALLRRLPEADAGNLLRRLRAGAPLAAVLNQVRAGDALLQMAVKPETRFRYVLPYRAEMPAACLGGGSNVYLDALRLYEAASVMPVTADDDGTKGEQRRPLPLDKSPRRQGETGSPAVRENEVAYFTPFHAARLVEPRLTDVKIGPWTHTCDDEPLMRELLGIFLRCEYQFTSAFHKDYFLEDLAAGRAEFCSSLLVNLVLAYASVCNPNLPNRSEYWNPDTLAYRFLAEARRLWELVAREPCLTTVQAGILFSVFYNLSGLDAVGQAYRIHAVALARELGIMDGPRPGDSARTQRGTAFTAWTMYNWETLVAFSFMHVPLVKDVPKWPLPDPEEDPDWYGQLWVQYPASATRVSLCFEQVFERKTRFRIIMHEFCEEAYGTSLGVNSFKAEGLRRKLQRWFEDLPESLDPRNIVLPSQLQIHMYYHHILLSIYEPLLEAGSAPYQHTPTEIVASSRRFMHTLVRIYFLRHGYEAMDLFIVVPLMILVDECLERMAAGGGPGGDDDDDAALDEPRATLMLVARGLHDQRRNHYLGEALWRVLRGKMRREELALLRRALGVDGEQGEEEQQEPAQVVRSHWPVSVVKKEDLDSKTLGNLFECYAHLNVDGDEVEDVPMKGSESR